MQVKEKLKDGCKLKNRNIKVKHNREVDNKLGLLIRLGELIILRWRRYRQGVSRRMEKANLSRTW